MCENQRFVDLKECFDGSGSFDIYCDIDFVVWKSDDLHIKINIDTETEEIVAIKQEKCLTWLHDKGTEL